MVAANDGRAVEVYRAANAAASPLRYEIDPRDIIRVTSTIDDAGLSLGAIYHSHTRSEPFPSQTDINLAFFPGSEQPAWPEAGVPASASCARRDPILREMPHAAPQLSGKMGLS